MPFVTFTSAPSVPTTRRSSSSTGTHPDHVSVGLSSATSSMSVTATAGAPPSRLSCTAAARSAGEVPEQDRSLGWGE